MKPINLLHKLRRQFPTKLLNNDLLFKSLISASVLLFLSSAVWFMGPNFAWQGQAILTQPEKRLYVILFLFLLGILKFLLIDLNSYHPFFYKDAKTRKKAGLLQQRFDGALQFLKKTTVSRQGKISYLTELPWYLLIGPANTGKTSLLTHSNVNFILQKRFPDQDKANDLSNAHLCDWWITRDAVIVDMPSNYLFNYSDLKTKKEKFNPQIILWKLFLYLIKKHRGKKGLHGIIIALPLPEFIKNSEVKKYHALLRDLFQRLHELHKTFSQPINCHVLLTKCDLLPGFNEFFAESGNDEINQIWGVTLSESKTGEKLPDVFMQRFNSLIKRLNKQLLWRLHQERNPLARPFIKDFPLQVERLKDFTLDFIKRLSASHGMLNIQGVYLTSSEQSLEQQIVSEALMATQHGVQLFTEPKNISRSYFVKQFFTQALVYTPIEYVQIQPSRWKQRTAYTVAAGLIGCTAFILGKDFKQGVKQTYSIQNELSEYQLALRQFHNPNEQLISTLKLLNSLQESTQNNNFSLDWEHIFYFYSQKSSQKTAAIYLQSLQTVLLPEIKNYFEDFLKNPVDKNVDTIYAALKAYIMLSDAAHLEPKYIITTLGQILPKTIKADDKENLFLHLKTALTHFQPLNLNIDAINETRKFLLGMPSLKLSYIILKNMNNNNIEMAINLGIGEKHIFTSRQANQIPKMFAAKDFTHIFSQEIMTAAQEAILGNWILGANPEANQNPELIQALAVQLRVMYINNYIDVWETILSNIHLANMKDLSQIDSVIINLIGNNSPLLQLLKTIYENTYFEPIISNSAKLRNLGLLLDKKHSSDNLLYQVFINLQSLHQYIQTILTSDNPNRAAFAIISDRVKNLGTSDAITQLLVIASKSPEPLKTWLETISNDAWRLIMHKAGRYIDTSWKTDVLQPYQTDIQDRYPFTANANKEVDLQQFALFFGNPGTILNFYNQYLIPLVDTSKANWQWKNINGTKLPFADETLHQVQQAIRIHQTFFPNNDNKLLVQFALQPYKFDKQIKNIKLNINDKQITDDAKFSKNLQHMIIWPTNKSKVTSVQLTLQDQKTIQHRFSGEWGWFKLINQSFESSASHKELILNFSQNEQPAKYLLFTKGQFNPFLSLNLHYFRLPNKVTNNNDSENEIKDEE